MCAAFSHYHSRTRRSNSETFQTALGRSGFLDSSRCAHCCLFRSRACHTGAGRNIERGSRYRVGYDRFLQFPVLHRRRGNGTCRLTVRDTLLERLCLGPSRVCVCVCDGLQAFVLDLLVGSLELFLGASAPQLCAFWLALTRLDHPRSSSRYSSCHKTMSRPRCDCRIVKFRRSPASMYPCPEFGRL